MGEPFFPRRTWLVVALTALLGCAGCGLFNDERGEIPSQDNAVYAGPPQDARPVVVALSVFDTNTRRVIQSLSPNETLVTSQLPGSFTLSAETMPPEIGSVRFDLDGATGYRTADTGPYTLDPPGAAAWTRKAGAHTVTATPFSASGATGLSGTSLTVAFSIDANTDGGASNPNTQDPNAQNPNNAGNTNVPYDPSLPVTHIYDFANGIVDGSPVTQGRVNGSLVSATLANATLITQNTPSATGMRLPSRAFAHYTGSFTIEQWFTWAQAAAGYEALFSISVNNDTGMMLHPKRGDSGLLSVDVHPGNNAQYSATGPAPAAGVLTFVAVVYEASNRTVLVYVNGTQTGTVTMPVTMNLSALAGGTYTGVGGFSPFGDPGFNGSTRRFIVQPVALSAQQVAADAADPSGAGMP